MAEGAKRRPRGCTLSAMRWWVGALTLLMMSCSGGARELGPGENPSGTVLSAPQTELAAEDAPWVEFEARWLCDLERSAYEDPSDVEVALEEQLAAADLDEALYRSFTDRLEVEPELRAHVQAAVFERCG